MLICSPVRLSIFVRLPSCLSTGIIGLDDRRFLSLFLFLDLSKSDYLAWPYSRNNTPHHGSPSQARRRQWCLKWDRVPNLDVQIRQHLGLVAAEVAPRLAALAFLVQVLQTPQRHWCPCARPGARGGGLLQDCRHRRSSTLSSEVIVMLYWATVLWQTPTRRRRLSYLAVANCPFGPHNKQIAVEL